MNAEKAQKPVYCWCFVGFFFLLLLLIRLALAYTVRIAFFYLKEKNWFSTRKLRNSRHFTHCLCECAFKVVRSHKASTTRFIHSYIFGHKHTDMLTLTHATARMWLQYIKTSWMARHRYTQCAALSNRLYFFYVCGNVCCTRSLQPPVS